MKQVFLVFGLVMVVLSNATAGDTITANSSLIEYTGRIDFTDSLAPKFSYSGVSIRACFYGTSIAAIMNDDQGQNYYNVILDGVVIDILNVTTGKKEYLLAEGLVDTIHEIELFKRTELTFGKTQFYGFIVDEEARLGSINSTRDHFIEYIGNSITCGYGNEGQLGGTFGPTTENHYMTYAAITSRNFNARHMAVSRSGIGIYRNYNGPSEGNADCMTNYYGRIFLYDEQPLYDFSVQPDVICINLGTNDFSTTGGDSALFVSNYFRLIDTLQIRYDMPTIVCLAGPMLSGSTLANVKNYLEFIVDSASNKGEGDVFFFELSAQGSLGLGIDYHPTVAQHEKNAAELTDYLQSLLSWKIHPLIKSAKTLGKQHILVEFNTPVYDPQDTYSGFSVFNDIEANSPLQVYRDTNDQSVIHILLEESILAGENIYLGYMPGTIESQDSIGMERINGLPVENTLTQPDFINSGNNDVRNLSIELFPNPNKSRTIHYSIDDRSENFRNMNYEIFSCYGTSIQKGSLTANDGFILVPALVSGVYYINFYKAGFRQTLSFVIA